MFESKDLDHPLAQPRALRGVLTPQRSPQPEKILEIFRPGSKPMTVLYLLGGVRAPLDPGRLGPPPARSHRAGGKQVGRASGGPTTGYRLDSGSTPDTPPPVHPEYQPIPFMPHAWGSGLLTPCSRITTLRDYATAELRYLRTGSGLPLGPVSQPGLRPV